MQSEWTKRRMRGGISINILLCLIFISTLICSTFSIFRTLDKALDKKLKLIDDDYRSRKVLCEIKMNLYYSIEEVYEKSEVSDDFDKEYRSRYTNTYKNIEDMKYFRDEKLTLKRNLSILNKEEGSFVFYLTSFYREDNFERKGYFRCEVKNPYKCLNLSEKREISTSEVKKLVEVVEIRK